MGAILLAALRHPFVGRESAKKLVAGSFLNLIPVVNFLALGYALRLMRHVLTGEKTELPAWEGWGGLFLDGLRGARKLEARSCNQISKHCGARRLG